VPLGDPDEHRNEARRDLLVNLPGALTVPVQEPLVLEPRRDAPPSSSQPPTMQRCSCFQNAKFQRASAALEASGTDAANHVSVLTPSVTVGVRGSS